MSNKKIINFEEALVKLDIKKADEMMREVDKENYLLLKELVETFIDDLSEDQLDIYQEVSFEKAFRYKEHDMRLVRFRGRLYILHCLKLGLFEFIGEMDEIIDKFLRL